MERQFGKWTDSLSDVGKELNRMFEAPSFLDPEFFPHPLQKLGANKIRLDLLKVVS